MKVLLMLAAIPLVLWLVQSALLKLHGLPIRRRLDARQTPAIVRTSGRIATQLCLAAVVLAYPLTIGRSLTDYYAKLLPPTRDVFHFAHGFAAATLFLCVLFGVWLATHRLEIDIHHSRRKWMRRLILLIPTALLGALVEELIFRGIVLADLLRSPTLPREAAIAVGAMVFAVAHYVRTVKRRWTFPGHVMLGVLLCIAFLGTGNLWLAVGLHAGGIFMIMGLRPFVRYRGPAWLTGASIFPFAGVVGIAGLLVLTGYVVRHYGVS